MTSDWSEIIPHRNRNCLWMYAVVHHRLICEYVVSGGQDSCSPLMFMQVNCYGFSHNLHSTNSNLAPIKT